MVIYHACRLHESVADCRAHKVETAFFQIFTHRVRFWSAGRETLPRLPGVHSRLASGELPDIAVKRAEFLLHRQERPRIQDGRGYLEAVADDAFIAQKPLRLSKIIF